MPTILLLLDAFRSDYLDPQHTPFLYDCARKGVHFERVKQSYGFCERAEIFTGMIGRKSGFFSAIGFDPESSPFRKAKFLDFWEFAEKLLSWISHPLPARYRRGIHKRFRRCVVNLYRREAQGMPAFNIPLSWLGWFCLTEDKHDHRDPSALPGDSLFRLSHLHGKNINYDSFTALNFQSPYHTDQERLDGAVRSCRNAVPADLYLIYLAAPDAFGHLYGPDSKELRKRMRIMDVQLARFVNEMDSLPVDCDFLFLGDHGMHAVQESVDGERVINSLLRRCGLKKGRDVVYFLDSTMIRIWFLDSGHSSSLIDLLRSNVDLQRCGEWLDVERARELGIPWPDRRYGDLLWLAREGVQVFPDFFHRHVQPKGMHGYDPRLAHAKGTCIYWGSRVKMESAEEINLSDVHQLLREILGI